MGGAAASAATLLAGCSKKTGTSDDAAGEPQVIKDDSKIVSITEEYEAVDIDLKPTASWTLPLGTLLYYCDGGYAAAMMRPHLRCMPTRLACSTWGTAHSPR